MVGSVERRVSELHPILLIFAARSYVMVSRTTHIPKLSRAKKEGLAAGFCENITLKSTSRFGELDLTNRGCAGEAGLLRVCFLSYLFYH